jgi:hypothetical protein
MMFSHFGRKWKAEEVVAGSRLPWTTIRTTQFHDLIFMVVEKLAMLPLVSVLSGVVFQPVDLDEVAARLIALFTLAHLDAPVLGIELAANLAPLSEEVAREPETFRRIYTWQGQQFFTRRSDADHFIPLFYRQFSGKNSSRAPLLSLTGDAIAAVAGNHNLQLDDPQRVARSAASWWALRDSNPVMPHWSARRG